MENLENLENQKGLVEIYTTDPHDPFMRFMSTGGEFASLTGTVSRKNVLRQTKGKETVHIFPDHITAITFTPTKENN